MRVLTLSGARSRPCGRGYGLRDEIVAVGDVVATRLSAATRPPSRSVKLKPVFDPKERPPWAMRRGVNDGASCVIVTFEEFAKRRGLEVLATIGLAGGGRGRVRLPRADAERGGSPRRRGRPSRTSSASRSTRRSSVALNRPADRRRRGDRQRQRRRRRARTPDRRLRRPDRWDDGARAAPERRRARSAAAICSGGGQGDALLIDV